MVDPHGVPWPAFRCALPGSHCWEPVVAPSTLEVAGAPRRAYTIRQHQPWESTRAPPEQKMGLAQNPPKNTLKAMFVTQGFPQTMAM